MDNDPLLIKAGFKSTGVCRSTLHQRYQFQYLYEKNEIIDLYRIRAFLDKHLVLNEYVASRKVGGSTLIDQFGYKINRPGINPEISKKNKKKILQGFVSEISALTTSATNASSKFSSDYFNLNKPELEKIWFEILHRVCSEREVNFFSKVDLNPEYSRVKSSFRESYKSLLNEKKYNVTSVIIDKNNIEKDFFEQLRKFHIQVSGRETRSKLTWDIQYQMVCEGIAFVICLFDNEGPSLLSFSLIEVFEGECLYSVGVYSRARRDLPLGHLAIAQTIQYSKKNKYQTLILGDFLGGSDTVSEKEMAISHFKSGFANLIECEAVFQCKI